MQNGTGQPAINLPLYWNAAGLPVGAHFVVRWGDETKLLQLAAQLEQAEPWAKCHPNLGTMVFAKETNGYATSMVL
jgi:amidase